MNQCPLSHESFIRKILEEVNRMLSIFIHHLSLSNIKVSSNIYSKLQVKNKFLEIEGPTRFNWIPKLVKSIPTKSKFISINSPPLGNTHHLLNSGRKSSMLDKGEQAFRYLINLSNILNIYKSDISETRYQLSCCPMVVALMDVEKAEWDENLIP